MESMTHPTVIRLTKGTLTSSHAIDGGDEGIGAKADGIDVGRERLLRSGRVNCRIQRLESALGSVRGSGFVGPSGDVSLQTL